MRKSDLNLWVEFQKTQGITYQTLAEAVLAYHETLAGANAKLRSAGVEPVVAPERREHPRVSPPRRAK
jgi:hypothetical protein